MKVSLRKCNSYNSDILGENCSHPSNILSRFQRIATFTNAPLRQPYTLPFLHFSAAFLYSQFAHNLSLNTLEFCCLSHLSMFTTPLFSGLWSRLHFFFTFLGWKWRKMCLIASIFRCDTVRLLSYVEIFILVFTDAIEIYVFKCV